MRGYRNKRVKRATTVFKSPILSFKGAEGAKGKPRGIGEKSAWSYNPLHSVSIRKTTS
jgi:hypothetical protein